MTAHASARRVSVLVVDDDKDAADSLALFLRLNGYDVRIAYCGEQAMTAVGESEPDVALLDIVMSGEDGVELAARMRIGATRPILLVAVTGVGTNDEVARVKAGTFDYFFLKPVDPDELLRVLDTYTSRTPAHDLQPTG